MPFTTACPSCAARLQAPDAVRGKRVKCKKCGEAFVARPVDDEDEDDRPSRPAAKAATRPRPRPVDDDEDDRPRRPSRASRRDDEDDYEEDRPPRRRRDGEDDDEPRSRRGKRGRKKAAGVPGLVIALLVVGALVVLGGGGVAAYFLLSQDKTPDNFGGNAGPGPFGPGGGGGPPATAWVNFSAPDGTFAARFPQHPRQETRAAGAVQADVFTVETPQQLIMVVAADIPNVPRGGKVDPAVADQALEAACNAMVQRLPAAREVSRRSLNHQGHPARELVIESGKGGGGTARVIIAGGRLYNLLVAVKAGRPDGTTVQTFFDGFRIS